MKTKKEKILKEIFDNDPMGILDGNFENKKLQELHNATYKPRPQWWIDKVTNAYLKAKQEESKK